MEYPHDPAHGSHPEHEDNPGHDSHPTPTGCGRLTVPSDGVQGVTGLALARAGHGGQ